MCSLTWRNIIIRFDRDVLPDFHFIDIFQYGESVADTGNPHLFQLIVLEGYEHFAIDALFWMGLAIKQPGFNRLAANIPMKASRYWRRFKLVTN